MEALRLLPPDGDLFLVPSRLSASERDPSFAPNFSLRLRHPLLSRVERCPSIPVLRQLHSLLLTSGLARSPFAHSRLLASAALPLHADLRYALRLFLDPLHPPSLFTVNTMIRAFSRSNRPDVSVLFYVAMLESSTFLPDGYTYPFLLKACAHGQLVGEGLQVHAHAVKNGYFSDPFVANSLVRMYADFVWLDSARKVFDGNPHRDEVSWASMIGGYVDAGRTVEALGLFRAAEFRRMRLDRITLATVLKACARERDLGTGEEIHRVIKERNIEGNLFLENSLMKLYTECGQLETARAVFNKMRERDSYSWNILIKGYSDNGELDESISLIQDMVSNGVVVDDATILAVVSACQQLDPGVSIHGIVREVGLESNLRICNALICMYSRVGFVELGRQVFDEMSERDVATWNSMVSAYAQCGSIEEAHNLFDQMPKRDNISWSIMILGYVRSARPDVAIGMYKDLAIEGRLEPDRITILSALAACSDAGSLEEGERIHQFMVFSKMPVDTALGTALIDMYAKCGCLEKAIQVFGSLPQKDVLIWTALISGFAVHGRGQEALEAFREMQNQGDESVKPNSITFLSVLSACVHAGLVEEGAEIYRSMASDHGIEPDARHNGCMVDLLARAGMLDEAARFLTGLGASADVRSWGAIMSASRFHGKKILGAVAAREILGLDPMHDGAHIHLSNVYAEAGWWFDSKETRKRMEDEDISKELGRSWIEVNGVRHYFTAGEGLIC